MNILVPRRASEVPCIAPGTRKRLPEGSPEDEPVVPGQESFPRHERLTRKAEFERIYRDGDKWVGGAFLCYVVRQAGQGRKIGCAVSRKVGQAVVRNRVKRFIREIYRTHRRELPEDVHVAVIARPDSARLSYRQCREAMRQLFRRSGLISEESREGDAPCG